MNVPGKERLHSKKLILRNIVTLSIYLRNNIQEGYFLFLQMLSCLGLGRPTYQTVGNLDYLVDRDISTWSPQFDYSPWDVADALGVRHGFDSLILNILIQK